MSSLIQNMAYQSQASEKLNAKTNSQTIPNSLEYLYQAISLIETKNNNSNNYQQFQNQQISQQSQQHLSQQQYHHHIPPFQTSQNNMMYSTEENRLYQAYDLNSTYPINQYGVMNGNNFSYPNSKINQAPVTKNRGNKERLSLNIQQSNYIGNQIGLNSNGRIGSNNIPSRLEKAKQFARKIKNNPTTNSTTPFNHQMNDGRCLSSVSQCSGCSVSSSPSQSVSPLYSQSSSPNLYTPIVHNQSIEHNTASSSYQPTDIVNNFLPFYLNPYFSTNKPSITPNTTIPNIQSNPSFMLDQLYFQNLINIFYALSTYQQQQLTNNKPSELPSETKGALKRENDEPDISKISHNNEDDVEEKVNEHFKRSLGKKYYKYWSSQIANNKRMKLDNTNIINKLKPTDSCDEENSDIHSDSIAFTDECCDCNCSCQGSNINASSEYEENLVIDNNLANETDRNKNNYDDISNRSSPCARAESVSLNKSNILNSSSESSSEVDDHFLKALGQDTWNKLKKSNFSSIQKIISN